MHINVLLTELAMHLICHFMLEMAVSLSFSLSSGLSVQETAVIFQPGRDVKRRMGQQNNNQSLTPNNNAEFNLLFWSVVRDGPVQ